MTLTAYVLTFLLFMKDSEPAAITQAFPDRWSCEKTMGELADKAAKNVNGWLFVGKPCEPVTEPVRS